MILPRDIIPIPVHVHVQNNLKLHHISPTLLNHFAEFSALIHFNHDIRSSDEFPSYVKLGNGGPIAECLDSRTIDTI